MKSYTYMKHRILYLFVAAAMLAACQDDLDNETFTISDEVPAATWLSSNDSTTMWTELLRYTDLYNTINLDGTYTLFVPTDSAMQNYLKKDGYASVRDIDSLYAVTLVKYATIAKRSYTSLNFNNNVLPDTTATGDRLTVTFDDSGNYWVNDEARIDRLDIEVTNGVIFLLDAVLEPITETLHDYIASNPGEYSIFEELLDVTGVAYDKSVGRSAYTLFLVPNDKFEQAGIHNMNELAAHLGASADPSKWKNSEDPMYRFAAYHFLSTIRSTKDLATSTSLIVESMADAAYLEFLEESGIAYINYDTIDGGVQIEEGNIACKNGIIHVVDGLLEIKMPSQLPTVKFDLTDNACLREDPNYAVPTLQEQYTRWLDISDTTALGYKWDPLTSSVGFEVAASSDSVRMQFVNYDALVLNLGQYEDIEITTPTIIADSTTYDITLSHYNPFADEYGNRITIYVDDEMIGTITTSGESVEDNLYVEAKVGSVTFPETSKHIVRILDNTGATIELDQIVFTPKAKK